MVSTRTLSRTEGLLRCKSGIEGRGQQLNRRQLRDLGLPPDARILAETLPSDDQCVGRVSWMVPLGRLVDVVRPRVSDNVHLVKRPDVVDLELYQQVALVA